MSREADEKEAEHFVRMLLSAAACGDLSFVRTTMVGSDKSVLVAIVKTYEDDINQHVAPIGIVVPRGEVAELLNVPDGALSLTDNKD